jgi:hypothetical protein
MRLTNPQTDPHQHQQKIVMAWNAEMQIMEWKHATISIKLMQTRQKIDMHLIIEFLFESGIIQRNLLNLIHILRKETFERSFFTTPSNFLTALGQR